MAAQCMFMYLSIAIACGYVCGSFPSGIVLSRLGGRPDPRDQGSGHSGAMNVFRASGWGLAALVMLADVFKGALAATLGTALGGSPGSLLASIAAVIGHCWPVFAGFKGGMGLATAGGSLAVVAPRLLGMILIVYLMVLSLVRRRYLATLISLPLALAISLWVNESPRVVAQTGALAALLGIRFLTQSRSLNRNLGS